MSSQSLLPLQYLKVIFKSESTQEETNELGVKFSVCQNTERNRSQNQKLNSIQFEETISTQQYSNRKRKQKTKKLKKKHLMCYKLSPYENTKC